MKKSLKRAFSMIIAVLIITVSSMQVFATGDPYYIPDAITVTIYATPSGSGASSIINEDYGHAFVEIENFSERPITVGARTVASGKGITVGRWRTDEHRGIYYNLEAMRRDKDGYYYCLTRTISTSDLNAITSYLLDSNTNIWEVSANCSNLAMGIWNIGLPFTQQLTIPVISTPDYLVTQIKNKSNHSYSRPITTISYAYYAYARTSKLSKYSPNSWQ